MTRIRTVVLFGLFALWPAFASAQIDVIIDWAGHWSGPGPWDAKGVNIRVWCAKGAADSRGPYIGDAGCWKVLEPEIRSYLGLRVSESQTGGFLYNRDNPRFDDTPSDTRSINALTIEPEFMVRLHPLIDVGAGLGIETYWGEGFDSFSHFVTTPLIVSISPLAALHPDNRKLRSIKVHFQELYYPYGFEGKDFGNTATKYKTRNEWVPSAGFAIDIIGLFK